MDIKAKVIKIINSNLQNDLNNLENIEEIHEKFKADKEKVEECLSLVSSEAPSKIQEALKEVNEIVGSINEIKISCKEACSNIDKRLQNGSMDENLNSLIEEISCLEKALSYLNFVKFIEDLCNELEVSLLAGNDDACISSYVILKDTWLNLKKSSCANLKKYISDLLQYWYDEIQKILVIEYDKILKELKWPFLGTVSNAVNVHSNEKVQRFKILTQHLFHLQLPDEILKAKSCGLLSSFQSVCLPVALLVKPLKQRFVYHFSGPKQTNRLEKPEWFFTKILNWIKDHCHWIEQMVQPVADSSGFKRINVKTEFMRALVRLAVEKLHANLSTVQYDDSLFAHTIDEALGFERELREYLFYPPSEPATVFVLTQAQTFLKWITMEKKYATEKMDSILSSETAWSKLPGFEKENLKVTECAEAFITLLSTISDRYNHLPQPRHRLQFLDLQLELIDDWRLRLLQLLHSDFEDPLNSIMPSILNNLQYVTIVLKEWGASVPFLQLYFFKIQCEDAESNSYDDSIIELSEEIYEKDSTIFDEIISLLERLINKLIGEINDSVFLDIISKSKSYRDEKWFSIHFEKDTLSQSEKYLSVTASGCLIFQEIANRLHTMKNALNFSLFEQARKNLAIRLDRYLLEEIVLASQFSLGGAKQLQYDLKRNLLPLFGLYTEKPELYFQLSLEACTLLNMSVGSAILLLESLETGNDDTIAEVLADVNIKQLSRKIAIKVLKARMDLCNL